MIRRAQRLASGPHRLDYAAGPAGTVGNTVVQVQIAESTNAMLLDLARDGAVDGTVLIADHQSGGRGKGERRWFSRPQDSLCASVLLRRRKPDCDLAQATLVAAVAVHDAFMRLGVHTSIKWPNDILLDGRKVCGILAEGHVTVDGEIEFAVVGFGINVSIPAEQFPSDLQGSATSLQSGAERSLDRGAVLAACLESLDEWVNLWEDRGFGPIAAAWRRGSNTLGRHIEITDGGERLHGIAIALADDGSLVLRDGAGRDHHIHSGDIRLVAAAAPPREADR